MVHLTAAELVLWPYAQPEELHDLPRAHLLAAAAEQGHQVRMCVWVWVRVRMRMFGRMHVCVCLPRACVGVCAYARPTIRAGIPRPAFKPQMILATAHAVTHTHAHTHTHTHAQVQREGYQRRQKPQRLRCVLRQGLPGPDHDQG